MAHSSAQSAPSTAPSSHDSWRMFDRIAPRYDLLNRVLSGGTDVSWRKKLAKHLPDRPNMRLLDMATGTGDVMLMLHGKNKNIASAVGMDMSWGMLHLGWDKIRQRKLDNVFTMVRSDAQAIAAPDESFDAVTIAFGIRNVPDYAKGVREMYRILKPGGRALILEFSLPGNALLRTAYLWYFRNVLPRIGAVVSGDSYAYKYLNQTVEAFPYGEAFCDVMRDAGFENVHAIPLTFGIASIYRGDKAAAQE